MELANDKQVYPVFVQSHVLERLYERLHDFLVRQSGDMKDCDWILQLGLYTSLKRPRLHPTQRSDGSFLVEYRLGDDKVGYVVASRLDDVILVETFLFLTMDGTPEGDELWKQWRLERAGKQYHGLDYLSTFLETDLALDPGLVEIFGKCGCGHLFKMGQKFGIDEFTPGYAADIRKYLRLED